MYYSKTTMTGLYKSYKRVVVLNTPKDFDASKYETIVVTFNNNNKAFFHSAYTSISKAVDAKRELKERNIKAESYHLKYNSVIIVREK